MFRIIWFGGCFAVSLLLAAICQSLIPVLTSEISTDGISHGIYDLLTRSNIVQIATGSALFGLFMTLLGLGGQVLVDGLAMRKMHHDLLARKKDPKQGGQIKAAEFLKLAAEAGDLQDPSEDYVASANAGHGQTLQVTLPATRFFGIETQVHSRLHLWLFSNLSWLLIGSGLILLFLAVVSGIDDILFRSMISTSQPISGLLAPLQTGFLAISITLTSAILLRVLVRFFIGLRNEQTVRFNALLDSLFLVTGGDGQTLHQPLKTLSEAQALIAEDRTEQIAKVIDSALAKLTDTLAGEFQSQIKSTSKLLEETEKQVTKSTVAVQEAHDTLAKYARGQSGAIDKAIGSALNSHLKAEEKARVQMANAVAESVKALEKSVSELSKANTGMAEKSLKKLNQNYGGGLADTAENLKQTQSEIARLVVAIESLTADSLARTSPSPARDEYLRLVGSEDEMQEQPPLSEFDLGEASENNEERVDRLTKALKLGNAGQKPNVNTSKKKAPDTKISSALKFLKNETKPSDLPDL